MGQFVQGGRVETAIAIKAVLERQHDDIMFDAVVRSVAAEMKVGVGRSNYSLGRFIIYEWLGLRWRQDPVSLFVNALLCGEDDVFTNDVLPVAVSPVIDSGSLLASTDLVAEQLPLAVRGPTIRVTMLGCGIPEQQYVDALIPALRDVIVRHGGSIVRPRLSPRRRTLFQMLKDAVGNLAVEVG